MRTVFGVLLVFLFHHPSCCIASLESDWWSWSNAQGRVDSKKTSEQLVKDQGLEYVPLTLQTRDGFVCTMFNIRSPDQPVTSTTPLVLFHGILDSSDAWIVNGEQSFAFAAAKAGHDVYLMNNRGNVNCREHVKYTPKQSEFWAFSWDQMAEFDVPDSIDFVLSRTKATKVAVIAHSQGTTQLFAALTSQPNLKDKISDMIAFAPVAYISHSTSPVLKDLTSARVDAIVDGVIGPGEILGRNELLEFVSPRVCTWWVTAWGCTLAMRIMTGYSDNQINYERMAVFMKHFPSGTSSQNMNQWGQNVRNPKKGLSDFSHLSFGSTENLARYNSANPPAYNLRDFPVDHVRLSLMSGSLDPIANTKDVSRLLSDLPPSSSVSHVNFPDYDHTTFLWGKHLRQDVTDPVLTYLDQISAAGTDDVAVRSVKLRVDVGWTRKHGQALAWAGVISATVFLVGVAFVVVKRRGQRKGVGVLVRRNSPKPLIGSEDLAVYHRAPSKKVAALPASIVV